MSASSQPTRGGRVSSEARAGWVPAGQISSLLGLSLQRLRDLARDGHIPSAERGQYPFVASVQGYLRFLTDEDRRSSRSQAESSLRASRQAEIEQRIARKARQLVATDEVIGTISAILNINEEELAGLPNAVTADPAMRRRLADALGSVFARSRSRLAERAASLRTTGTATALLPIDDEV